MTAIYNRLAKATMTQATDDRSGEGSGYLLVGALASGGMAEVSVVVRQEGDFQRLYALKRLLTPLQSDPQVRAMFLDEARFAGLLRHSHVVSVLDVGEDEIGPYLVMEYVDGIGADDLLQALAKRGRLLPCQIAARIAAQVARGLHAAHELRHPDGAQLELVHRDVSPQNILLGFDGVAKVTDFGIAKATSQSSRTATGVIKGKLGYLTPEQLRFEEPDRRSDLFALGIVLFELLSGRRLYKNKDGMDGVRRILHEPPPDIEDDRPDVPPTLVALLFRLLAKDPAQRPASALEVARVLEDAIAELAAEEGPIGLADYLPEHFDAERQARQRLVDEGLERLARGIPPTSSSAHKGPDETPTAPLRPPRPSPSEPTTGPGEFTAITPSSTRGAPRTTARIGALLAVVTAGAVAAFAWPAASTTQLAALPPLPVDWVTLAFDSEPRGAAVTIDSQPHGRTPVKVAVPRADATSGVTFRLEGYAPTSETLSLETSQRLRVALRPLPASSPSAAAVAAPRRVAPRPRPPAPPPRIRRIGER